MLGYHSAADSHAAAPPSGDHIPSASASTAVRAAIPSARPSRPAAQYNQPIGNSGRRDATSAPTTAKATWPSAQTASSGVNAAGPSTAGFDRPSAT